MGVGVEAISVERSSQRRRQHMACRSIQQWWRSCRRIRPGIQSAQRTRDHILYRFPILQAKLKRKTTSGSVQYHNGRKLVLKSRKVSWPTVPPPPHFLPSSTVTFRPRCCGRSSCKYRVTCYMRATGACATLHRAPSPRQNNACRAETSRDSLHS
jgi:hypothetical protein